VINLDAIYVSAELHSFQKYDAMGFKIKKMDHVTVAMLILGWFVTDTQGLAMILVNLYTKFGSLVPRKGNPQLTKRSGLRSLKVI